MILTFSILPQTKYYFVNSSKDTFNTLVIFLRVTSVGFWFLPASILIIVLLATVEAGPRVAMAGQQSS
jgi:hypothetical protein